MTSAREDYNNKDGSSAGRGGQGGGVGGREGQGLGGARWGGHAKRGREQVHRRETVRVVLDSHGAPREVTTTQGQLQAQQSRLQHEQRHDFRNEEELDEEEEYEE